MVWPTAERGRHDIWRWRGAGQGAGANCRAPSRWGRSRGARWRKQVLGVRERGGARARGRARLVRGAAAPSWQQPSAAGAGWAGRLGRRRGGRGAVRGSEAGKKMDRDLYTQREWAASQRGSRQRPQLGSVVAPPSRRAPAQRAASSARHVVDALQVRGQLPAAGGRRGGGGRGANRSGVCHAGGFAAKHAGDAAPPPCPAPQAAPPPTCTRGAARGPPPSTTP